MPIAYTPGLRVTGDTTIRATRRLPTKGEVLVAVGQRVEADAIVARAEMPGELHTLRAAQMLGVEPHELTSHLTKRPGDTVEVGEVIASTAGLWGLFRSEVRAPVSGRLEEVSEASGHVRIRQQSRHIQVRAHVAGQVAEVLEGEGAVIEARGALIQGIFGVGGERRGPLRIVSPSPQEPLRAGDLGDCTGCVLVAGAGADGPSILRAADAGAAGLVVGAVRDEALRSYVGYDIGVAITGQEDVPMTLIITEGFGQLAMAQRTWDLLVSLAGRLASINGATQIRAGVIRPEIIVTREELAGQPGPEEAGAGAAALAPGARVRIIREPRFGALGRVSALPPELTEIETGSRVRVARVRLDEGDEVVVPRANLELIQE